MITTAISAFDEPCWFGFRNSRHSLSCDGAGGAGAGAGAGAGEVGESGGSSWDMVILAVSAVLLWLQLLQVCGGDDDGGVDDDDRDGDDEDDGDGDGDDDDDVCSQSRRASAPSLSPSGAPQIKPFVLLPITVCTGNAHAFYSIPPLAPPALCSLDPVSPPPPPPPSSSSSRLLQQLFRNLVIVFVLIVAFACALNALQDAEYAELDTAIVDLVRVMLRIESEVRP
eukprot:19524-Rhodomonas_salina.1